MMHFPVFKGCKCSGKTGYFTPQPPKGGELVSSVTEFPVFLRLLQVAGSGLEYCLLISIN